MIKPPRALIPECEILTEIESVRNVRVGQQIHEREVSEFQVHRAVTPKKSHMA
jgi:hypothetical protein